MLLSLALFVGWTAVGLAVLNLGRFRGGVRKLLLAPTVGLALITVVTYIALQAGWPVGRSAAAVGGGAVALALGALWRTRATAARVRGTGKRFAAFAAVIAAAFFLTGWPLFHYGFDWVANGNDDMANYCIGAAGFQAHGYLRPPTVAELRGGGDITRTTWFLYRNFELGIQSRCGSELTLALAASWTGLSPQQVFMPVVVALNAALVAATAGLVLLGTRRRAAALWAAALLTVSSQTGYAVVQQLIAQAGGLALLCVSVAMVASPFRRFTRGAIVRRAAVCGVTFAGLVVFYPEAVPFLVGACVLLGVRDLARRRLDRRHLGHAAAAIAAMAVLVPVYLYGVAFFLLGQAKQGADAQSHTVEIFPYFMTPRGPALMWGLLPSYADVPEPRQSASMVLGLALLAAALLVAVGQFRRGRPFAAILLVMSGMAVGLYTQKAAFGLFKIAMFMQPFLWATVATWAVSRRRRWRVALAAAMLLVVAGLNARTQHWYVKQSTGHDGRVDLPAVTQQQLLTGFRAEVGPRVAAGQTSRVLFASENNVLVKLLAAEVGGVPNTHLAMSPTLSIIPLHLRDPRPYVNARGEEYTLLTEPGPEWFVVDTGNAWVTDPETGRRLHQLMHTPADWTVEPPQRVLVVAGCGKLSVLNRSRYPETGPALVYAPLSEVRNVAVFRDATDARQNYLGMGTIGAVAMHRPEPDPDYRHRSLVGVGRRLVLDVLNPSPRVRLLADYTTTFTTNRASGVPVVQVVGDRRVTLPAVGIGSARLVSPPLSPQAVGASNILALDFGVDAASHVNRLSGVEKLWGAELPRDRRRLSVSARNISVISDDEYAAFRPPQAVTKFPDDLAHPHLEYSGVYESGWAGKEFKFRLTQPAAGQELVLRGRFRRCPARRPGSAPR